MDDPRRIPLSMNTWPRRQPSGILFADNSRGRGLPPVDEAHGTAVEVVTSVDVVVPMAVGGYLTG